MFQAVQATTNRQSNSILSLVITTSIQENYHKRLFLESWHSTLDSNTVNERKPLPGTYIQLIYSEIMTAFSARNNVHHSSDKGGKKPKIEFYQLILLLF